LRAESVDQLDDVISEMIATPNVVIADIRVAQRENCFPMIPSGRAHYEMILGDGTNAETPQVTDAGLALV
jgi:acetolactate synthase-1/2/3 large subunit